MNKQKRYLIMLCLLTLSISCKQPNDPNEGREYIYQVPEQTGDGWTTAAFSDVGMDENQIKEAIERIRIGLYSEVHAIVIVKDGKLVFEEYFPGHDFGYRGENFHGALIDFDRNTGHNTHSATKSIASALVGIAIDQGFIQSVDEKIFDYFGNYSTLRDSEKDKITIEHLLTMTSGLQWNEWDVSIAESNHDIVRFNTAADPVRYVLSKPVITEPGTSFYYNGAAVDLLGEIVRIASDYQVDDFSGQYLFGPLGITSYQFQTLPSGLIVTHGDIYLRPRDLAKFGYLFLNNGVWNGNRIISEEWIKKSIEAYISLPFLSWANDYGYLWWLKTYTYNNQPIESFKAIGWGGQEIIIFPGLNMVVVFTGANYVADPPCDEIIARFVLPAVF